ncbi:Molybdate transporter [Hyphodiscus hymeniophilus]|uniref:Molybdate-anion transporter n=1 Tax=Hyphodiscus hymeniophilus TaxID=353542 RepID=A0A9P7AZK5_9HELO|nr:Molybdate transporter [Hyphodiscus hymeniophilus]
MNFYDAAFLLLIVACGILTWRQYRNGRGVVNRKSLTHDAVSPRAKAEASKFTRLFLMVYCLVQASDWLQGPYIYSLYHDEFGLSERTVALLFTTGYLTAAISGYFVGQFADKYGRKLACLIFCVTYSIACASTLVPNNVILFSGRGFGGLSASLMSSAFESWMVTEYHKRQLDHAGMSLSSMFGIMTTINSIVAIISGIFSEWLVEVTHTQTAPFMASTALLSVAFWIIWGFWSENYGESRQGEMSEVPVKSALKTVFTDKRVLTLGLASCFFEGSITVLPRFQIYL